MHQSLSQIEMRGWRAPGVTGQAALFVTALLVCIWGAVDWPASFWPTVLVAMAFWTSISLGCLGIGLLHHLTGGMWGWGIAKEMTAAISTVPLTGLFLVPIIFGARWVFPWARSLGELNSHQQIYLAPPFVLMRTVVEWVVWSGLALWHVKGYRRTSQAPTFRLSTRMAAVGLVLFWFSVTSAAIDGLMSLEPANNSSVFGAIEVLGCVVGGLAWILLMRWRQPTPGGAEAQISHDLGNLLFAFNFIWLYLAFSQYIIVWAADLPHETRWHAARQRGTAGVLGVVLLFIHFIVPFGLLLSANLKRRPRHLAVVAGILLAARLAAYCWTVLPACPGVEWRSTIGLLATSSLLGTLWVAMYRYGESRLPTIDRLLVASIDENSMAASAEMTP